MDSSSNKDVTHRQLVSRRDVFGIAAGSALVFSSSAVSAETPKDPKDKAAAIAKQMVIRALHNRNLTSPDSSVDAGGGDVHEKD